MPQDSIEFYHRSINPKRKQLIAQHLQDGSLKVCVATDALGMGMDFKRIQRVILWMPPLSFLSLVQKIGRCVRDGLAIGEAIIYLTAGLLQSYVIELEESGNLSEDSEDEDNSEEEDVDNGPIVLDRDNALDEDEDGVGEDDMVANDNGILQRHSRRKRKGQTPIQQQDRTHLLKLIVTDHCRWIPWDLFFDNGKKELPIFTRPDGARCCDNCEPDLFPQEVVELEGSMPRIPRLGKQPTLKQAEALTDRLGALRGELSRRHFGSSRIFRGKMIMSEAILSKIVARCRQISSQEDLKNLTSWSFAETYGDEVVRTIKEVLKEHLDPRQEEQARLAREKSLRELLRMAHQDFLQKFHPVAQGCYDIVCNLRRPDGTLRCQMFRKLPNRSVCLHLSFVYLCLKLHFIAAISRL
jgi:hypothetical protein